MSVGVETPNELMVVFSNTISAGFDALQGAVNGVFGLMIVLVVGLTWLALDWKGERDEFRSAYWQADWRVRYTKQANPDYYSFMEAQFKDTAIYKWIGEQEEADQKRALAREAAEQAKALSRQANELEGKEMTKGKKKG